eukprot:Nitzschia sp. Nitz4//scaffold169_size48518//23639//24769//NITZ4_007072-RA/size48518-processed-gene-0.79-mRNA-1//1//CDS//3329538388//5832//frame0
MTSASSTLCTLVLLLASFCSVNAQNYTIDLSALGNSTWSRLRPGWSLTVNDQCLYEFVFQFEHDETLPISRRNFEEYCAFKDPTTKNPYLADDGEYYLVPRAFWERFPSYVWATIGFNHLSIEWWSCGHMPRGYALPQYTFSFYRVTPEFRALAMTCETIPTDQVTNPADEICEFQQNAVNGMKFFIVPGSMDSFGPVVNMPETFVRPDSGEGPVPHVGLRSWDQEAVPDTPNSWEDSPLFMSSYDGDLVMWQPHIPYKLVSGDENQFTSNRYRYHRTTMDSIPDTHSFHYTAEDGIIRFSMVGTAGLCRDEFEAAEAAAGGAPVFPNWDDVFNAQNNGGSDEDDDETKSASIMVGGRYILGWLVGWFFMWWANNM